jgi:phosphosulfolactate synthase
VPLDLPSRSTKPRDRGITHVLDRGLSLAQVDGMIEVAGEFVDIVKLGWGTALATQNLEPKLARYAEHGIPAMLGGTLTEIALRQEKIDDLLAWLRELRLTHIELSDGSIPMESEAKCELIRRFVGEGLTVLSEVGSKDNDKHEAPYIWVEKMQAELEAGAWKVIAEARESGTAGIFRGDGEVRMGLIDEIAHAIEVDRVVFEAPRKDQQVWFLQRFGADCNLGNIAPDDVLGLETLRLGLRSDTIGLHDA